MPDPFVHLHVASGYSLQYGASHPHTLVERAVEQEMDTLALTDRDGTYGAVKFAKACLPAASARCSASTSPTGRPRPRSGRPRVGRATRTPVRGGAFRDARLPRVTLLASGRDGWAAICRLVSATHLAGERGSPVADLDLIAPHLATGDVLVLLGPGSALGEAATRRRDDLALEALAPWRELVAAREPPGRAGLPPAARLGRRLGSRHLPARRPDGRAGPPGRARRGAHQRGPLRRPARRPDRRRPRRRPPAGRRSTGATSTAATPRASSSPASRCTTSPRRSAGWPGCGDTEREARQLLARTRAVADRCALDPRADLGLGEVHFPEFELSAQARRGRSSAVTADVLLRARCEGAIGDRYGSAPRQRIWKRLDDELEMIGGLGYASYFLTVGDVTDLIRDMGVRCAARGSGAGSLVNYLLGVSGVDPLRHDLLMERFLSPLRQALPDIDIDVESARRLEVYEAILDRYGGERCVCVSMMDTYRVRHAVRDVGAALGMPPGEIDAIAKAFPHIRARDARVALRELPELRACGLGEERLDLMFRLVERLDGLPRHIAVHPCGVLLSDATLLDRTPVEASFAGFPMSQFDKDDVEDLGLLKLDVLGIRMQSSMAHALDRDQAGRRGRDRPRGRGAGAVRRPGDLRPDLVGAHPRLFQIESPGQRELVGKSGIETFEDIITDISLFRPGPGQERHGHALPRRQAGLEGVRPTCTTTCARSSRAPTAWSSSTSR